MNCTNLEEKLDDYLDGDLSAGESRALEAHVAVCRGCAKTLAVAKRLQQQAFVLQPQREPARDLWPAIAARLEPRHASKSGHPWWRTLAAGVAVVGVFAGGMLAGRVLLESGQAPMQLVDGSASPSRNTALPGLDDARRLLPASHVELIEGNGGLAYGGLQTDTEQTLLRNLLMVNIAIRDVHAAVENDPSNTNLRELLAGLYAQENRILGQAERLRAGRQTPTRTGI